MIVKEVMTEGVHSLTPEASIQDAAELMKAANVGMLPVVDHKKVVGVITDRDLVTRCLADNCPKNMPVREVMSSKPVLVTETSSIDDALDTMAEKKLGRILVQDSTGKLTGVLSATDAAATLGGQTVGRLMVALKKEHQSKSQAAVARLL